MSQTYANISTIIYMPIKAEISALLNNVTKSANRRVVGALRLVFVVKKIYIGIKGGGDKKNHVPDSPAVKAGLGPPDSPLQAVKDTPAGSRGLLGPPGVMNSPVKGKGDSATATPVARPRAGIHDTPKGRGSLDTPGSRHRGLPESSTPVRSSKSVEGVPSGEQGVRCPIRNCNKLFRNGRLLLQHVKVCFLQGRGSESDFFLLPAGFGSNLT